MAGWCRTRWSAAFDNLGVQDREAAVRICPVRRLDDGDVAAQFHFEVRACDAAASPHLALAALVHAGAAGIEAGLAAPGATAEDLSLLPADALRARGYRRLPTGLSARRSTSSRHRRRCGGWFPDGFAAIYLAHKRKEIASLEESDEAAAVVAYQSVY